MMLLVKGNMLKTELRRAIVSVPFNVQRQMAMCMHLLAPEKMRIRCPTIPPSLVPMKSHCDMYGPEPEPMDRGPEGLGTEILPLKDGDLLLTAQRRRDY